MSLPEKIIKKLIDHYSSAKKLTAGDIEKLLLLKNKYIELSPEVEFTNFRIFRGICNVDQTQLEKWLGKVTISEKGGETKTDFLSDSHIDTSWTLDYNEAAKFASGIYTHEFPDPKSWMVIWISEGDETLKNSLLNYDEIAKISGIADFYNDAWDETLKSTILQEKEVVCTEVKVNKIVYARDLVSLLRILARMHLLENTRFLIQKILHESIDQDEKFLGRIKYCKLLLQKIGSLLPIKTDIHTTIDNKYDKYVKTIRLRVDIPSKFCLICCKISKINGESSCAITYESSHDLKVGNLMWLDKQASKTSFDQLDHELKNVVLQLLSDETIRSDVDVDIDLDESFSLTESLLPFVYDSVMKEYEIQERILAKIRPNLEKLCSLLPFETKIKIRYYFSDGTTYDNLKDGLVRFVGQTTYTEVMNELNVCLCVCHPSLDDGQSDFLRIHVRYTPNRELLAEIIDYETGECDFEMNVSTWLRTQSQKSSFEELDELLISAVNGYLAEFNVPLKNDVIGDFDLS